jgi:arginyl-tRNA synthetase
VKAQLETLLGQAIEALRAQGLLPAGSTVAPQVERARDAAHGDFATNLALSLARAARLKPRELAERIVAALPPAAFIAKTEIAGPGFINFFLRQGAQNGVIRQALAEGGAFGHNTLGAGRSVLLEFVSANPNGPLHVGHGRGAAYGDSLARLLRAAGYRVDTEYYVNDAGRQMDILAVSVWLRYLELCGINLPFPANGYRGDYVWDFGANLHRAHGARFARPAASILDGLPPDEAQGGDKDAHVDTLIARCRVLLGAEEYRLVHAQGLNDVLADIRHDLAQFGVAHGRWFSESSLMDNGAVERALADLQARGALYEQDGALWFRATAFGDDKDRVVRRENGAITYFASDIAYHLDKLARGYDLLIDIWGSDHHGYVARVKAALAAAGADPARLDVQLVQFAVLYRGGAQVQMSTRSGEFVTLRELRQEVGNDAARFFYAMRRSEAHLDFDLDLARSQSNDNPVYYVQYAHARVCSVFRQAAERGLAQDAAHGLAHLDRLDDTHEQELIATLARYPEVVASAARGREPHQITWYARELAQSFHTYYNACPFLVDDAALRDARLCLIAAVRQALCNALNLIGVSAPEQMSKTSGAG